MNWNPMETAPTDGTPVDLWVDWGSGRCSRMADVSWIGDMANWAYKDRGGATTRLEGKPLCWIRAHRPPKIDPAKTEPFDWSY